MTPRAAFFDVDRTLVRVNTAQLYVRWRFKHRKATWQEVLRTSRWVALYKLGIINAHAVMERALRDLAGTREDAFQAECEEWYEATARNHVTMHARDEVAHHREQGIPCVILTGGTHYTVSPLARDLGIEHVLCTRLEVEDGKFTGTYQKPLCYGEGKVELAMSWAKEHQIELAECAFYTDSISDLPMLNKVGVPFVINPDPRLRLRARQHGWPIKHWL